MTESIIFDKVNSLCPFFYGTLLNLWRNINILIQIILPNSTKLIWYHSYHESFGFKILCIWQWPDNTCNKNKGQENKKWFKYLGYRNKNPTRQKMISYVTNITEFQQKVLSYHIWIQRWRSLLQHLNVHKTSRCLSSWSKYILSPFHDASRYLPAITAVSTVFPFQNSKVFFSDFI